MHGISYQPKRVIYKTNKEFDKAKGKVEEEKEEDVASLSRGNDLGYEAVEDL